MEEDEEVTQRLTEEQIRAEFLKLGVPEEYYKMPQNDKSQPLRTAICKR